eukprot:12594518-Ditylum_brightwellii.AAC.1
MNDWLEQFLPRDNRNPQVKLADNELIDILKNAVPKFWQGQIYQALQNLELLDPPKQAQRGGTAVMSSTGTNQKIPPPPKRVERPMCPA